MSVNKVFLMGNVGTAPRINNTEGGKIVSFSLATSERFRDRNGNMQEDTTWHNIVVFGKTAEIAERFLAKGSQVFIEGRIRNRKFTDREGVEKSVSDIVCSNLQFIGQKQQNGNFNRQEEDMPF